MKIRTVIAAAALTSASIFIVAERSSAAPQTLRGYVTDTWCGVNRDTKAPTEECTRECVRDGKGKYAFYNLADGNVYILNPQDQAGKFAGQTVTVTGTIDDTKIPVKTMRGASENKTLTATSIAASPDQL